MFGWGQAMSLGMLSKFDFLDPQQAMVLSGGCGGFVQGIVMSPALLLKTRVMTDPRFRSSGGVLQVSAAAARAAVSGVVARADSVDGVCCRHTLAISRFPRCPSPPSTTAHPCHLLALSCRRRSRPRSWAARSSATRASR